MDYSTWKYLIDNGYSPVEYIYKPDNFSNPNFGLGIIAYGNKYGLEVKMQASQEDMDYAMSGNQIQICGYRGITRIDDLPYQNYCMIYIRQNNGYYLGRQINKGWYTKPDGTIVDNSGANRLITPCDTDIHIVNTYYDSESDRVKTFLDGVSKSSDDSKSWENDLTAGTEYFVYGNGNTGQYAFKGRIYYIKTFDPDRRMTGYFLPCVRKSDGRAGLYDVVNSVFKISAYDYIKPGPEIIAQQIPWEVGSGYIILDYTGVKNDTVTVSSSENDIYEARSQTLTFKTTDNQISRQVTITQGMREPNFKTADGYWLLTADNKYFNVKEE